MSGFFVLICFCVAQRNTGVAHQTSPLRSLNGAPAKNLAKRFDAHAREPFKLGHE
jgi:hypothetical protein